MSSDKKIILDGVEMSTEEFKKTEAIIATQKNKKLHKIKENVYKTIVRLED